jgi:hypothetical protein
MTASVVPSTGIVLEWRNGSFSPHVYCSRCDAQIADANKAIVIFPRDGRRVPFRVLCKRSCAMTPEFRHMPWQGLDIFLVNLAYNSGLRTIKDWKQATEIATEIARSL